jgi:3-oxoacyl-[acyl-carrier protein] reductase/meso-butanediol dehydrogenase/(S,S)-butanediol dehydrogenase/diacetyl reductase
MITGAGGERGFGRAIARALAAAGADLLLTDVAPSGVRVVASKPGTGWGGLDAVAAEAAALGVRTLTTVADVRSDREVRAAVERGLSAFGRIDILVNNAAAPPGADRAPVVELPEEAWQTVLETNLTGSFLCARAVAASMLERSVRGRIINMASNCGKVGYARMAAYCASKFGLIGFTQALATELAPAGITVNAICPGSADTDRLDYLGQRPDGSFDEAQRADGLRARAASIPLGRVATAADVAELTLFLASDGAAYVTGQAINLAGGAIMH